MSSNCNNRFVSIFDNVDTSLMHELRAEAFSEPVLKHFIQSCLTDDERNIVLNSDDFLFVADSYLWSQIRTTMEHILSVCDEIPEFPVSDLISQTWRCLPTYLKLFGNLYKLEWSPGTPRGVLGKCKHTALMFMHNIITNNIGGVTKFQLEASVELKRGYYLSLDTAMIVRIPNLTRDFTFGQLVSKSKSKLRFAITLLQEILFSEIDIDGIREVIKSNKGTRYYNISTDSLVNSPTVKRMSNVSEKYKVVATKADKVLFNHIVALIDNEDIHNPVPMPSFETVTFRIPGRSSPRNIPSTPTNYIRDEWLDVSDSDEDTSSIYSSDDNDDDFNLPFGPKKSSKDKNPPVLRRAQPEPIVEPKKKRKNIPSKVRQMTWRKYIGNVMDGKCWCCDNDISFEQWHAGHVIPASKGGPDSVVNLRPLCQGCNLSMSNKHMADFIRNHDMKGKGAEEFSSNLPDEDVDGLLDQMASLTI